MRYPICNECGEEIKTIMEYLLHFCEDKEDKLEEFECNDL